MSYEKPEIKKVEADVFLFVTWPTTRVNATAVIVSDASTLSVDAQYIAAASNS